MINLSECNKYGRELIGSLRLRFSPIALKLVYNEDEVPEKSEQPFRDTGNRFALCQAYSLVRRNRMAITMFTDDHWCLWPLVCLKICPLDEGDVELLGSKLFMKDTDKSLHHFRERFPWSTSDIAPLGITMAPLETCEFLPDVVIIYCRVSQLRSLIMAAKHEESELWNDTLDPIVSCCYSTVPLLNGQKFRVSIPDPGEYERSLADEDEIIFSLRGDCLETLMGGLQTLEDRRFDYMGLNNDMNFNFPRAQFYDDMFAKWGLSTGEVWKPGQR